MIEIIERSDCPFCWKLRLALVELQQPFKSVDISLGEKHPRVVAASPKATVPVLFDGDIVVWESTAAIEYADEIAGGEVSLFEGSASERARIRLLMSYSDTVVGPTLFGIAREKRSKPPEQWDVATIEEAKNNWRERQAWLDQQLGESEYFGASYSAADCALAARAGVAEYYEAAIADEFPRLQAWFERVKSRQSWQEAYPHTFYKAY